MGALLATSSCLPEGCDITVDFSMDVHPVSGTEGVLVEEDNVVLWQVKWDNPVVGDGMFELPYGAAVGYAIREGHSWEYNKFDLTAVVLTPPNPPFELYTWPAFPGVHLVDDGYFTWETRGIALQPRVTGGPLEAVTVVQAMRDDYNTATAAHKLPGLFQLDPDVKVVPLTVVVMYPQPANASYPPDWVSFDDAALLFDDRWLGEKHINSDPYYQPDNVVGTWEHCPGCPATFVNVPPGPVAQGTSQPDRIFDQCDVQFRMVAYHQCPIDADKFWNETWGQTSIVNTLQYNASECAGIGTGPKVIFTGQLINSEMGAEPYGWYDTEGNVYVSSAATKGLSYVLAHELGHSLGLGDITTGCYQQGPNEGRLMCQSAWGQGPTLLDPECATAYERAAQKHDAYWGEQ